MNTKKPIDWTKPVQTTENPPRPLRVLCTDNVDHTHPVVCAATDGMLLTFRLDGQFLGDDPHSYDAQNAPEPEKPDPYAHLREALAEGKVIQFTFGGRGGTTQRAHHSNLHQRTTASSPRRNVYH